MMTTTTTVGPFETEPYEITMDEARALLDQAVSGVPLGAWDRRILAWLTHWEPATVAAVAGVIARARATG